MPINVSDQEWAIIQDLQAEFRSGAEVFKQKYAGKVHIDEAGNMVVKRIRQKTLTEGGQLRTIERKGLENIQHTFLITPDGNITAFGRKDEGAILGHGNFGTVRLGILRNEGEERAVAVKAKGYWNLK